MNKLRLVFALLLTSFLSGCVPVDSLNPFYSEKDVVFDSAILGQWGNDAEGINFSKAEHGGYQISFTSKAENGQPVSYLYDAHLLSLQGHRFLDVVPLQVIGSPEDSTLRLDRTKNGVSAKPGLIQVGMSAYLEFSGGRSDASGDAIQMKFHRAHQLFRVDVEDEGKTLTLTALDNSWIAKQIADGKLVIDHQMLDGATDLLVLTASTSVLQKLVLDHVSDSEVFNGVITTHRPGFQPASITTPEAAGTNH